MTETLVAVETCDTCGVTALLEMTTGSGPLYFCGHHGQEIMKYRDSHDLPTFHWTQVGTL